MWYELNHSLVFYVLLGELVDVINFDEFGNLLIKSKFAHLIST